MDANEKAVAAIVRKRAGKPVAPTKAPKERCLDNLAPAWEPGQSGNPAGKTPGTVSLRTILRARLAEIPEGADRRTLAEQLVDSTCKAALRGDAQARKLIWESIEGTPRQHIGFGVEPDPILDVLAAMRGDTTETLEAYALEALELVARVDADR